MKKFLLEGSVLLMLLGTGCSKVVAPTFIEKATSIPNLNEINTVEVGENMYLKRGNWSYYVELKSPPEELKSSDFNPWWLLAGPAGAAVMLATADYSSEEGLERLTLRNWEGTPWTMVCSADNDCIVDKNNDNHFTHYGTYPNKELKKLKKSVAYIRKSMSHPDAFTYVALYQGKVGNKIKVSYREFINSMSRPSFTQDIEYEMKLNKPTIIGFKGLRVEVLEATNMNVTYKVIKDYN